MEMKYKQLQSNYSTLNNTNINIKLFINDLFKEIINYLKQSTPSSITFISFIEYIHKYINDNNKLLCIIDKENMPNELSYLYEFLQLPNLMEINYNYKSENLLLTEKCLKLDKTIEEYESLCFENIFLMNQLNTLKMKEKTQRNIIYCINKELIKINSLFNQSSLPNGNTYSIDENYTIIDHMDVNVNFNQFTQYYYQLIKEKNEAIQENINLKHQSTKLYTILMENLKILIDYKLYTPSTLSSSLQLDSVLLHKLIPANTTTTTTTTTTSSYYHTKPILLQQSIQQQFSTLEYSICQTINCLFNRIDNLTERIKLLHNKIINKSDNFNQQLTENFIDTKEQFNQIINEELAYLQAKNNDWQMNVNLLFNYLSDLTMETVHDKITDIEKMKFQSKSISSSKILQPNEILPNLTIFMNDFQKQMNKIAIVENQCNLLNIELNQRTEERDQLHAELTRLQISVNYRLVKRIDTLIC
ncbi:unnamed protein product [Heterobilharzia americana]|nr:unnamed protein product [Heterobilharzia americana]